MFEQLYTATIFLGLFYGLVFSSYSPAWLFMGAMGAAYFGGLVDTESLLSKATNTGLVTLVLLLLVSIGLEKLSWLGRLSRSLVRPGYRYSLLRVSAVTTLFSAVVNNTAVVATLANSLRDNGIHPPSRLLLPLSYAAILGGTTTLIGTSTNLIVSSFLEDATGEGLAFFAFLPVGLAATAGGVAAMRRFSSPRACCRATSGRTSRSPSTSSRPKWKRGPASSGAASLITACVNSTPCSSWKSFAART